MMGFEVRMATSMVMAVFWDVAAQGSLLDISRCFREALNVVVEWLTLLLSIRESWVQISAGYSDWGSSWFFSVPSGKCRDSTSKLGYDRFLPHPLQFIFHLFLSLRHYIVWVTEEASLNKLQINKIHFRKAFCLHHRGNLSVCYTTRQYVPEENHLKLID
jgi:hypothetical protein